MTDMPRVNAAAAFGAELARLGEGATNAMCDSMLERLVSTAANAAEVVDKFNEPDIKDAVVTLLDALGTMHRTGVLQTLIDMMYMVHGCRNAMTDSIVDRVFAFMEHMANNVGTEDLGTLAHEAKCSMEDALDQCAIPGSGGGLMGTLRMLSKSETQEAMRFMLSFACSLRKRIVVISKSKPVL